MALHPTQDGQDDVSTAVDKDDRDQERRRSNVRIRVTYLMATLFASTATVLIVWLAWQQKWSEAISIFTSVGAMAGGVIGYWFGNRGASKPFPSTNELAPPSPDGPAEAPLVRFSENLLGKKLHREGVVFTVAEAIADESRNIVSVKLRAEGRPDQPIPVENKKQWLLELGKGSSLGLTVAQIEIEDL